MNIKQILPFKQVTKVRTMGKQMKCEWRMFLGKPFNIKWSEL